MLHCVQCESSDSDHIICGSRLTLIAFTTMRGNLIQTITGSGVDAIHKGLLGCRSWGNAFADAIKCKFQLILFGDANACARYPPFSRVNWACWMLDGRCSPVRQDATIPRCQDARLPCHVGWAPISMPSTGGVPGAPQHKPI